MAMRASGNESKPPANQGKNR
ncbi:MAG: hypothetical protein UZ09_BCD002002353, partial [Bacteroidetes bacterium OLB9]